MRCRHDLRSLPTVKNSVSPERGDGAP
jgi:hypothetical protein